MGNEYVIELKNNEMKKREGLREIIEKNFDFDIDSRTILDYLENECIIELIPPLEKEVKLQYIEVKGNHTGKFKGNSYKPGNIIINIKKTLISSVQIFLSVPITMGSFSEEHPIIGGLSLISTVLLIAGLSKVELTEKASLVVVVIWENRLEYKNTDEIYNLVNEKLKIYERTPLKRNDFYDVLEELQNIRCIEICSNEVLLKEIIKIEY